MSPPPDECSGGSATHPNTAADTDVTSTHHLAADQGQGTASGGQDEVAAHMPVSTVLSEVAVDLRAEVMREARERDDDLYRTAGCCLADMRDGWRAMDATERTLLLIDAFRWRWYWSPEQVEYRLEMELAAQRRLMAEVSHDIANGFSVAGVGPSHRELQRRRYPPDGNVDRWVREGPPGHDDYPGRAGQEAAA